MSEQKREGLTKALLYTKLTNSKPFRKHNRHRNHLSIKADFDFYLILKYVLFLNLTWILILVFNLVKSSIIKLGLNEILFIGILKN